jgi:hypothetical protein
MLLIRPSLTHLHITTVIYNEKYVLFFNVMLSHDVSILFLFHRKAELDLHPAWTPLPWRRGQRWRPRVHRARYAYMLALLVLIHQCHHFTLLIYIPILHPQAHQREIKIERGSPTTSSPPKTVANPVAAGVLRSKGST